MYDYGGLIRGLETVLEPDAVELVKRELSRTADALDRDDFRNLDLAPSAFGSADTGAELGRHHVRAQQVIAKTLEGVTSDIRDFHDGVVRAAAMLDAADTGAQGDLTRREAAVAALEDANRWFDSDQSYDQARNEHGGDR